MDNAQDMVQLQLTNQRLQELQDHLELAQQQLEHATIAQHMIEQLQTAKKGQEMLIPVGNGIFFSVQASDVKTVKTAVGAGVVVDKSAQEALSFVDTQLKEIRQVHQELIVSYESTVEKANQLQESIERAQQK